MSLTGRGVNFLIGFDIHLPFLIEMISLTVSFFSNSLRGASIIMLPLGSLRFLILPFTVSFFNVIPRFRVILVPRNFALPNLECVTKVFSVDNSSFSVSRNSDIWFFREDVRLLGPHTPIIQSSAYRTYSIFAKLGLVLVDFRDLLYFINFLCLLFNWDVSAPTSLNNFIFFFIVLACPSTF